MNTSSVRRSIETLPTKDRVRLANLMRGLVHEEPEMTSECVLGINILLSRSGLRLEDLALFIHNPSEPSRGIH